MTSNAEHISNSGGRMQLAHMPLSVANSQGVKGEPLLASHGRGRVGVEPAAQKDDRGSCCRLQIIDGLGLSHVPFELGNGSVSHTPRLRVPDELVQLQLNTHRQVLGKHPLGERAWVQHTVHR